MTMSTNINFPQGPIAANGGFITLEWQQWLQNPQFLSFSFANPIAVPSGGTGISSGTSGGIPAFTSATTMASSGVLGANQIVLGGGAGAVPTTVASTGTTTTVLHGNASGAPTFGAVNLASDVSGQLPVANGGTGVATASANTVLAGPTSGIAAAPSFRALIPSDLSMTPSSVSLSGNVALNNTASYFDGPTAVNAFAGTWLVTGTVTCVDTAGAARFSVRISDGTSVFASADGESSGANVKVAIAISALATSPAGSLRISVKDNTSTSGQILFNNSGNSKDSTITAIRIG